MAPPFGHMHSQPGWEFFLLRLLLSQFQKLLSRKRLRNLNSSGLLINVLRTRADGAIQSFEFQPSFHPPQLPASLKGKVRSGLVVTRGRNPRKEQIAICLIRMLCLILVPSAWTLFSPEAMFLCKVVDSFKDRVLKLQEEFPTFKCFPVVVPLYG